MNNEETILEPKNNGNEKKKENNAKPKSSGTAEKVASILGGAVVGAGATFAGRAVASSTESTSEEDSQNPTNGEDAIVGTSSGVRVAHVDDNASFSEAFADARRQVGPGGVFEWRGRVYGTYYKDEWDNMTPEERREYQSSINYNEVRGDHHTAEPEPESVPTDPEPIALEPSTDSDDDVPGEDVSINESGNEEPIEPTIVPDIEEPGDNSTDLSDNSVEVLEVGSADLDGDGNPEDVAVLNVNGEEVVVVDVDNDGIADVMMTDENGNEYIDNNEIVDISDDNIGMPDMGLDDSYLAQNDDNLDYMNDANVDFYA